MSMAALCILVDLIERPPRSVRPQAAHHALGVRHVTGHLNEDFTDSSATLIAAAALPERPVRR
jgi:hypothetical protein